MKQVAEQSGVTKGTLYLYFNTKEELFVELYSLLLEALARDLRGELEKINETDDLEEIAETASQLFSRHIHYVRLSSILHGVLENNLSFDSAKVFKLKLAAEMKTCAELLANKLSFIDHANAMRFLNRTHDILVGIYQSAYPTATVAEVIALPELAMFRTDFREELRHGVLMMLYGFKALQE